MGHGPRGSWVSSLTGQMGHASQNVTHRQLSGSDWPAEPSVNGSRVNGSQVLTHDPRDPSIFVDLIDP